MKNQENKLLLSKINKDSYYKGGYFDIFVRAIFWLTLTFGFFIKSFYIQYSIGLTEVPYSDDGLIIKFIILSAIIMTLIIPLIFGRFKYLAGLVIAAIVAFVLFADTLYGRYYGLPISLPILHQVGVVDDVSKSTASLMKWKDIVFLLDIPILITCLVLLRSDFKNKLAIQYRLGILGLIVLSVLGFNGLAKDVNTIHHAYERKNIAKDFGVYYYHGYDFVDTMDRFLSRFKSVDEEDLKMVIDYYKNKEVSRPLKHTYQGYNLVVVQVEALQEFVVDLEVEGQAITPFLNDLKSKHLYFGNIYHQVAGGNTSDAEFILNTSVYPAPVGAVNYLYPDNTYHSIAHSLNPLGYSTHAYHGYQSSFWNRTIMYNTMGYDGFKGKEDFVLDEKVGWAISDASFYRQALEDINQGDAFYKFLITLSSHHPYDVFRNDDLKVGSFENTQVGDYLKSMRYVDQTLEDMIKLLEEKGVLDKTILVIYGDHSGLYGDQRALVNNLLNLEDHDTAWQSIQKVPLWIITPDAYYQNTSDKVGGQIDILPTIAHLMDFEVPYTIGRSLLDPGQGFAVKRDGSIFTKDYFYLKSEDTLYDLESNEAVIITEEMKNELEDYYRTMIISDIILNYDIFSKKEFKEAFE